MKKLMNIVTRLHKSTERDCLARMNDDKVHCMSVARKFGKEFWDGDRRYGYGGYKYIPGRWKQAAQNLIEEYNLKEGSKILDVGCGKGFLLKELLMLQPKLHVEGFDISKYAIENSHPDVKNNLYILDAKNKTKYVENEFDLVISLATFHNLRLYDLEQSLKEFERIGKQKYLMVEAYENIEQLFNMQCWALTCNAFFSKDEWIWLFNKFGYTGDYEFIYF
ncbi:class I SAM-dependent methyltransferase [Candidatus Pelagibacter sp.]|uniref:class I SAM-dependent methyltransferase n=1 Tax=Candidatus Pelagibacter sp. TaxID=2024849 RepID=UPI003D0DC966